MNTFLYHYSSFLIKRLPFDLTCNDFMNHCKEKSNVCIYFTKHYFYLNSICNINLQILLEFSHVWYYIYDNNRL